MGKTGPRIAEIFQVLLQVMAFVGCCAGTIRSLPVATNLTNVFTVSVVCSIISGIAWAVLVKIAHKLPLLGGTVEYAGDTGGEPNGRESIVWSLIVFGPVILIAVPRMQPPLVTVGWKQLLFLLGGFTLGAFTFYGGRFRERVKRRKWNYVNAETLIALLWSAMLACPAFLFFEFAKSGASFRSLWFAFLRSASFVCLVWLPIIVFVALISDRKYGFVRGVIAGLCLEFAALSVTLATAERAKEWAMQLSEALGIQW